MEWLRARLTEGPLPGAKALLGWHLVAPGCRAQIVETEAYGGPDDPGSHAWRGQTPRNTPMYEAAGHAYVYFTYGMHWMLNVSAGPESIPAAVLLRAAFPLGDTDVIAARRPGIHRAQDWLAGPGRLAKAFALDGTFNGMDLLDPRSPLHLEPGESDVPAPTVGPRVGLSKGRGEDLPWRFVDARYRDWVSPPRPPRPSGVR